MTEYHDVQVVSGQNPDGQRSYQVQCSCGYDSRSFRSHHSAEQDADEHIIAMARLDQ